MISRRQFVAFSLAGLAAGTLPLKSLLAGTPQALPFLLTASDDLQGKHFISALDHAGAVLFNVSVPDRCHGGCLRPVSHHAVIFARRPGRHFFVVDTASGALSQQINAGADHHFYGHGVFSPDGQYLYATANHIVSGDGRILVYDATKDYGLVNEFPLDGMDPHELRLLPDGETLVVAMGGIHTHPDYDRIKLNLDTMAPATVLVNRHSGTVLRRYKPSNHQLSAHHLDVSPEGVVVVGYQYEGPEWEAPPLIALLDTRMATYTEIELSPEQQVEMKNYVASVAINAATSVAAITAPRGNRVVLINYRTGERLNSLNVPDVAGVLACDDGFLVTSGQGGIYEIPEHHGSAVMLGNAKATWDNHLTLVRS